ncbi:acyl-CoA dehydrogenase family protein [Conexibacter stalactiti]|uniref:Acyl-CoA dehydrogenase family protein n=1 Tax=Conexibacter stalactiti TaxID=1940611 RepID=A0ABU4HJG9_9ACTN|nr:acyl-CoA dehydrogenase family protein [Conexibacter stalactiti]MDW5592829.1 acyl-CoA dehydrogenase family protein [Conexibacter stalactiti]MEC5033470.1 acyl-CoA dehydrogenase family protein [Conexibacter stalactiti]
MGLGLRALGRFAGSDLVDRLGIRKQAEGVVYRATRDGFRAVGAANRTFKQVQGNGKKPARLKPSGSGVFDLTPTDEQQMLMEAFRDFGAERLRPNALKADEAAAAPKELLAEASELGLTMLGVPEELGGAVSERSAVTTVLAAEALAHGDLGLAVAALAPAGVATALSLWGDAEQQGTYLPALVADDAAVAAFALHEPSPLFDPFELKTTARIDGADYVLSGVKAFVPRAADAELLLVAARIAGHGPGLFLVETKAEGVLTKTSPGMGARAAGFGEVLLEEVRVPARALLGDGSPAVYAEAVRRARLGWCALAVGAAQAVLDYVIPYVNERVAFGEPISHRQSVAFAVSNIAIELEGMRLTTLRAAARADAEKDFSRETALARHLCGEKGSWIGSEGVQLLGGHGYIKEHPVERWYRDLRAVGVVEGALLV